MAKAKVRTFTNHDNGTTYHGFDRNFDPVELEHVAIVIDSGEVDLYALVSPQHVSGLVEYLTDRAAAGFAEAKLVGVYSRK